MDDLVRWLGEQLDEDERIAQAAGDRWRELSENWVAVAAEPSSEPAHRVAMVLVAEERVHIVRHDPARVLREIDADRALLRRYEELRDERRKGLMIGDLIDEYEAVVLPGLASKYVDRPGFKADWAPKS